MQPTDFPNTNYNALPFGSIMSLFKRADTGSLHFDCPIANMVLIHDLHSQLVNDKCQNILPPDQLKKPSAFSTANENQVYEEMTLS